MGAWSYVPGATQQVCMAAYRAYGFPSQNAPIDANCAILQAVNMLDYDKDLLQPPATPPTAAISERDARSAERAQRQVLASAAKQHAILHYDHVHGPLPQPVDLDMGPDSATANNERRARNRRAAAITLAEVNSARDYYKQHKYTKADPKATVYRGAYKPVRPIPGPDHDAFTEPDSTSEGGPTAYAIALANYAAAGGATARMAKAVEEAAAIADTKIEFDMAYKAVEGKFPHAILHPIKRTRSDSFDRDVEQSADDHYKAMTSGDNDPGYSPERPPRTSADIENEIAELDRRAEALASSPFPKLPAAPTSFTAAAPT